MKKRIFLTALFILLVAKISGGVKTNELNLGITGGVDADDTVTISRPSGSTMSFKSSAGTFTLAELAAAAGTTTRTGITRKTAIQGATIVAAGDSNMRFSDANGGNRNFFGAWPNQMAVMTHANPLLWDTLVFNEGVAGETATNGLARIDDIFDHAGARGTNPDVIIFGYGTNDILAAPFTTDPTTYITTMTALLDAAIASGTVPIIFNIPDMKYSSWAGLNVGAGGLISNDDELDTVIAAFNAALENLANEKEVAYLDINELLGEATADAGPGINSTNPNFVVEKSVSPDGGIVHLSYAGQRNVAIEGLNFLQTHGLVNSNNVATRVDTLRWDDPRISFLGLGAASTTQTITTIQVSDSGAGGPAETNMLINVEYRDIDNDGGGDLDIIEHTFLGTGVAVVFFAGETGIIDITVDSMSEVEVDTFADGGVLEGSAQAIVWQIRNLDFDEHTITIQAKNTKNDSSLSNRLLFAGLLIERGSMNNPIITNFPHTVTAPIVLIEDIPSSSTTNTTLFAVTGDSSASPAQIVSTLDTDLQIKKTGQADLLRIDLDSGRAAFGSDTPGENVGSSDGDYAASAHILQISETGGGGVGSLVIEGSLAATVDLWDRSADSGERGIRLFTQSGYTDFLSLDDDTSAVKEHILVLAHESQQVGIGMPIPGQDTGSSSGDYTTSSAMLHVAERTGDTGAIVIEGNPSVFDVWDRGGGVDDKAMRYIVDGGIAKFQSLQDDALNFFVDNIFAMDLGTGNSGFGAAALAIPKVFISNGSSGGAVVSDTDLFVEDNASAVIQITGGLTNNSAIYLGDSDDPTYWTISASNNNNSLTFSGDGDEFLTMDTDTTAVVAVNASDASIDFRVLGLGSVVVFMADTTSNTVAVGSLNPGVNVGSASGDYLPGVIISQVSAPSTGGTDVAVIAVEGDAAAAIDLWHSAGAANDKGFRLITIGGQTEFLALSDAIGTQTDNILVMDHGSGDVATGAVAGAGGIQARLEVEVTGYSGGYAAIFENHGNNSNNLGISIECGADVAGADHTFIDFRRNNGAIVGNISSDAGTPVPAFNVISDKKRKTGIIDSVIDSRDIISKARVRDYKMKESPNGPSSTGFIAQELELVYPKMVTERMLDVRDPDTITTSAVVLTIGETFYIDGPSTVTVPIECSLLENPSSATLTTPSLYRMPPQAPKIKWLTATEALVDADTTLTLVKRMMLVLSRPEGTTYTVAVETFHKGELRKELTKMIRPSMFIPVLVDEARRQQGQIEALWGALTALSMVVLTLISIVIKMAKGQAISPQDIKILQDLKKGLE